MLRDVIAPGPFNSPRINSVDGYLFPRKMLMFTGTAREAEALPEQAHCSGVMAKPQRTGGKWCLYRQTSSPMLTSTRRRSLW